jgi:hypothetical protein
MFAPAQMIISGPRATLGREFKTVRKGLIILARKFFHQNIVTIKKLIIVDKQKLIIIS